MNDVALTCHQCGAKRTLKPREKIYRQDTCAKCDSDLRSCFHCRFYDPSRNNECSEPQAEWVRDKSRSNFCDYFEAQTSGDLVSKGGSNQGQDAQSAFDSLFNK